MEIAEAAVMSDMLQRTVSLCCVIRGASVIWSPMTEATNQISLRETHWRDIRHVDGEEELSDWQADLTGLQRLPWGRLD